jgi:hypothetical protein
MSTMYNTDIYGKPEELFEVFVRISNANLEADINRQPYFHIEAWSDLKDGRAFLHVGSWDIIPEKIMRDVSLSMLCKIRAEVYDEEHTTKLKTVECNKGITMYY